MGARQTEGSGYERFYLRANPADEASYARKARGYERKLGRLLADASVTSCLDIGCATGLLAYWLAGRGYHVVGVDAGEELIEIARANVAGEFVVADAIDFAAGCRRTFDVVFLMNVLEHIPRDRVVALLSDLRGLLRDGGFVLARTPNMNNILGPGHFANDFTHCAPLNEVSLRQVAEQAGFSRVVFCDQFRMQRIGGKVRACLNHLLHWWLFRLRGGRMPKIFYRNLYVQLFP